MRNILYYLIVVFISSVYCSDNGKVVDIDDYFNLDEEKVIDFFINHKFKIFKINNIAEKKEEISKEELLNFKNKDKVTNLICKRII